MEKHLFYYTSHSQFFNPINRPSVSYCEQEDEVHYHPDPFNGHEYVDLGLPSGTLWAKCNVGANSETDYGLYFAWGETQGYANASTKAFSWSDYKFNPSGDGETFTKYNATDGKTMLDIEDDVAYTNMGGDWHMPTGEQCRELFSETTNGFVTNAGVFTQYAWNDTDGYSSPTETTTTINNWGTAGHFFFKNSYTSVTDAISAEDYLFIPAAGYCNGGEVIDVGEWGNVWYSSLSTGNVVGAWYFYFGNDEAGVNDGNRCCGQSVRGVIQGPVKYTYSIGFQTKDDNELFTSQSLNRIPTVSEQTSLMSLCALTYDSLQKVILTFEDGTVVSSEGKNPKNYIEWGSSRSGSFQYPLFTWQASIFPNNFNMPEQVKAQSVTIEVYIKE